MSKTKYPIALLAASAAFFTSLIGYEGYKSKPYLDSAKVATIGIGSTTYENGTKVKMTDKPISKERAIQISKNYISKDEAVFKKTLSGVKLSQIEYDLYLDFNYQFGTGAWSQSSMLRNLKAGQYKQACQALLAWRKVTVNGLQRDCSVRSNNCYGVWTRQVERHAKCIGAQ